MIAACGTALLVISFASIPSSPTGQAALGTLGMLLLASALVLGLCTQTSIRNTQLAQMFPDAHLVMLLGQRGFNADMRSLQGAFKRPRSRWGLSYNATLVIDTRMVRFFRGGKTPRLLLEMPAASITGSGISRQTPAGTAAVEHMWIGFQTPAGPIRQSYVFATTRLFPKVLHNRDLMNELREFSLAAGRTVPLLDPAN